MMMMTHEILGALSSDILRPSEASAEDPISSWCFWAGLELGKTHHPNNFTWLTSYNKTLNLNTIAVQVAIKTWQCKSDPKVVISIHCNLFRCGRAAVFLFGNLWLSVIHVVIHIIMVSVVNLLEEELLSASSSTFPFQNISMLPLSRVFSYWFLNMFLHSLAYLASPVILSAGSLSAGSLRKELPGGHFFCASNVRFASLSLWGSGPEIFSNSLDLGFSNWNGAATGLTCRCCGALHRDWRYNSSLGGTMIFSVQFLLFGVSHMFGQIWT